MGSNKNRRTSRKQTPSLERKKSGSETEASQGDETMIETLSNFQNVSPVRDIGAVLDNGIQNENELQVWTQRITDKTNKKISKFRKKMKELESGHNSKYREQTNSHVGISRNINHKGDEINASYSKNQ